MDSISLSSHRFNEFQVDEDDQVLFNEVVATLNDLGHYNRLTNKYQLNLTDHSACLRDLIRFLRNDGQNFLVRRQMGISNIVDNDLLPIVEQHTITDDRRITETGKSLMDKIIRLLVDLTNPTMLHYPNQKIPKDDKYEINTYLDLQNFLFQYKLAFSARKRFWIVLSKFLTHILELDSDNRQVEDELMMERIIILVRNVLHIPIISRGKVDDSNVHDRIVEHMSNCGLLDIFQYMISNGEYSQYCFHLLEIIFLIFREQNAEFLAKSVGNDRRLENQSPSLSNETSNQLSIFSRSQYEREYDRREFEEARNRDRQEYVQMMAKFKADDFTRFKETAFVIKNMKAVSDRDMICYRAYSNPEKAMDFNKNKIANRRPRNRRPMNESVGNSDSFGAQRIHCSSRQLRSVLYDLCAKFLSESYNQFMAEIRSNLNRGTSQEHDETYFLWACQFFMEFNRYQMYTTREQRYQQVCETLSTSMFHYIQTIVDDYMDHLLQKKEFRNELNDWSKRLHQALRAYRELLYSLSCIESMNLPQASKMCFRIKTDIFTEPEYREMLLRLMQTYNEEKMSKAYLRDLIETNHLFLKMLEYHAKISLDFKVKVKKRKRTKRNNKEISKKDDDENVDGSSKETNLNNNNDKYSCPDLIWIEIIDEVGETLNSELNAETILGEDLLRNLFDPLSDQTLDEQKLSIMRMVQKFLKEKQVNKAVALFREARNVLAGVDDDNAFGEVGIEIDDEMLALNGILMTNFPKENVNSKKKQIEKDDDEPLSDEADDVIEIQEKTFTIEDTLMRYAHPNSVRACRLLLHYYRTNSAATNHAIAKLLHRIAVNLKMKPMFYNLNYFMLFEQIMDDPLLHNPADRSCPHYKSVCELATFAVYIVRNFFKLLAKHPKIASEICFTVNSREAYQMEYGFDSEVVTQMIREKKGLSWNEPQKLELEVLYNEYKDKATKEKDVVDLIQEHLIDDTKTRRQIINQLKKMDLLQKNDIKKNSYKSIAWSNEELEELKSIYEKFKDNLEFEETDESEEKEQHILTTVIEESIISDSQREREYNGEMSNIKQINHKPQAEELSSSKQKKKTRKRLDIIDCILKHLSTQRNRRQIIRQLKILNIYDHSAGKKWTPEQIEELRILFCNLFIDFKQCELIDSIKNSDENEADNKINVLKEKNVNKENFMDNLLGRFSDKTKSTKQILRQLHKMDFTDSLKTIGIVKDKSSKTKTDEDLISDDDIQENEDADDEVVIQYDDDDDDDDGNVEEMLDHKKLIHENTTTHSTNKDKINLKKNRERLEQMASNLSLIHKDYSQEEFGDEDESVSNEIKRAKPKKRIVRIEDDHELSITSVDDDDDAFLPKPKYFKKIQLDSDNEQDNNKANHQQTIESLKILNSDHTSKDDQRDFNASLSKRKLIDSDDEDIQKQNSIDKKRRPVIYDDDE